MIIEGALSFSTARLHRRSEIERKATYLAVVPIQAINNFTKLDGIVCYKYYVTLCLALISKNVDYLTRKTSFFCVLLQCNMPWPQKLELVQCQKCTKCKLRV